MMNRRAHLLALMVGLLGLNVAGPSSAADPWVTYRGTSGPGLGKRVVLISGDEEYRSEEALPQLARILATRHGFTCTVLFAVGDDGAITPTRVDHIPGLEALRSADLMIIATRFRDLPDDQMAEVDAFLKAGKPVIGLRTATHAFNVKGGKPYARYSWQSKAEGWDGGFGRQVLGETWVNHHGAHGKQSTRGIVAPGAADDPILRGIKSGAIWGPTDVYEVRLPLPGDSRPLVLGEVVADMTPTGPPLPGPKNDPMMPVAWVKSYQIPGGRPGRTFATTMGAATDLSNEGVRRLLVNATYWGAGLEAQIRPDADVALVGDYRPRAFGFGGAAKGVRPESLQD